MNTNNNPVGGFTGHSTGEREKYELITAENTERSGWAEAMNATTITSMLHVERIKKLARYIGGKGESTVILLELKKVNHLWKKLEPFHNL